MQVSKESVLVLGNLIVLFPTTAVVRKIVLVLVPLLSDPRSHGKVRLVLLFITIETISIHISLERLTAELIIIILRNRPPLWSSLPTPQRLYTCITLPVAPRGSLEGLPIIAELVILGSLAAVYLVEVQIPYVHLVRQDWSPALIRRGIVPRKLILVHTVMGNGLGNGFKES